MNNTEPAVEYNSAGKNFRAKLPKYLIFGALAAGIVCAILFSVLLFTSFDSDVGYFKENFITEFAYIFTAVLCLASAAVPLFFINKKALQIDGMSSKASWASVIPSVAMLGNAFFGIYALSKNSFPWLCENGRNLKWIVIAWILLSLLASVYFCLMAVGKVGDKTALIGFAAVLQSVVPIAITYTDVYVTMNNPEKIGIELACAVFMLFITAELRFILNKPAPRQTITIYCIAFIICASVYIPFLIGHIAKILTYSKYLWFSISGFLCTVYIAIKAIFLSKSITQIKPSSESGKEE